MLTIKILENAKPREARYELADGGGLYLIIQSSGVKSWAYRYRFGGKSRKFTLGNFPALQPADKLGKEGGKIMVLAPGARTLAAKAKRAVLEGRDPAAEQILSRQNSGSDRDLFSVAATSFIFKYAKPRNRSWKLAARYLGLKPSKEAGPELVTVPGSIAEKWSAKKVTEITKRDVLDHLDYAAVNSGGVSANRTSIGNAP